MNRNQELQSRFRSFALRVIRLFTSLSKTPVADVIGKQVLRSGTSVGAHYHEGFRARSSAEFISKLEVALQELSETRYWLDLLVESEIVKRDLLADLQNEVDQLTAILVTSVKTAKQSRCQ